MKGKDILTEVQALINDPAYSVFTEINRAYRSICRTTKYNWLRETNEDLLAFKAEESTYRVRMAFVRVLQGIWVREPSNERRWRMMEEVSPALYEERVADRRNNDGSDNTSRPEFYKLEGGPTTTITVTPTPDQSYTVRVNYIKHIQSIGLDDTPALPEAHLDTVAQLAAGYILETSSDPVKQAHSQKLIGRATENAGDIVRDTHANRTRNIDRVQQAWLR